MTGHCSKCGKIWTLETRQGVCQWCDQLAVCQSSTAKPRSIKSRSNGRKRQAPTNGNGYDQLDGEWLEWYQVAKLYERKVPYQDRADIRHTIILELAQARAKTTEPIPLYRAYRIASYMVADYYRQQLKLNTGLDCRHCSKAQRQDCKEHDLYSQCPKLIRLEYLESEHLDSEGNRITIQDTLVDDTAIDLDAWQEASTFLLGCPIRLVELAYKRRAGIPLNKTDSRYYERQRQIELKRYQRTLF
jgi:hypothetical protein